MSAQPQEQDRARDFERFLTFVDAIVAIAITLLILPLVDLAGELDKGDSVAQLLADNRSPIGAFFLSFLVIANLWLAQHRLLRNVIATNPTLTWLLLLWCLTIVVLPFPTSLTASGVGEQAGTKIIYVGTMALSAFLLSLVALVVAQDPGLRDSAQVPDVVRTFSTGVTFVIALLVMLAFPATSYWPLLLLLVNDRLVAAYRTRRARH